MVGLPDWLSSLAQLRQPAGSEGKCKAGAQAPAAREKRNSRVSRKGIAYVAFSRRKNPVDPIAMT